MNNFKKALVLAGGVPQIKLINILKKRNYKVILADYTNKPVASEYADVFYQISTLDIESIKELVRKENVDLIITVCTDQALNTVALVAEEFNLPCYISASTGLNVTNKKYMKELFKKNNIPTANFNILTEDLTHNLKYPLIVKPADCNSSKGVTKVFNITDLKNAFLKAKEFSRTNTVIVEEYIEGREISVDALVKDGKAQILCASYSDKIKNNNKFVINRGYYPIDNFELIESKLLDIIQKIANAFKLINSPLLVQLIESKDGLFVLEFSARTGGCIKYHMIELATGFDIIEYTVDLFEKKPTNINFKHLQKIIVNEFIYCNPGKYLKVNGFEECKNKGYIENYYILKSPGSVFNTIGSSGDRIAAITILAETHNEYVQKHNQIAKSLQVINEYGKDIMCHDLYGEIPYEHN